MVVRGLADLENQSGGSSNNNAARRAPSMGMPMLPPISEMLFPGIKLRSFIAIMTLIDFFVFILTLIVGQVAFSGAFVKENPSVGPDIATLRAMGGSSAQLIVQEYQVWRYLTPVVLHAGLRHIGFNMFFQCNMGFVYEELWGAQRMAIIYWISGLCGTVFSVLLGGGTISVGASGALMGMLGGIVAFVGWNWNDLPNAPTRMCTAVVILVLNAVVGLQSSNIDNYAHLGGLIGGLLAGTAFLKKYTMTPRQKTIRTGAGAALSSYLIICILLTFITKYK